MSVDVEPVRPTRICLENLELVIPPFSVRLSDLDHPLIKEAQRVPELDAAGGSERILSLKDRVWLKVKASRWRGAAVRLSDADDQMFSESQPRLAPWWLGAGGYRREGDPSEFYADITAAVERSGSSDKWLPSQWDWKRLELEHIYAWDVKRHLAPTGLRPQPAVVAHRR